jgi:hypothetical protein
MGANLKIQSADCQYVPFVPLVPFYSGTERAANAA